MPALWHYTGGAWEDVTTSYDELLRIICGRVTSFSPFAVLFRPAGPSYTLTGPFRPVEARPAVNAAEPGRTIPVKFSLGGAHGLDVFAAGYPRSDGGACGGASTGEPAAAGPEGLAYDAATGVYTFHWKTSRSWKGQCRTLTLRFADGSELVADFRFR